MSCPFWYLLGSRGAIRASHPNSNPTATANGCEPVWSEDDIPGLFRGGCCAPIRGNRAPGTASPVGFRGYLNLGSQPAAGTGPMTSPMPGFRRNGVTVISTAAMAGPGQKGHDKTFLEDVDAPILVQLPMNNALSRRTASP